MRTFAITVAILVGGGAVAALSFVGCGGPSGPAGGPAVGPQDTHCDDPDAGMIKQPTDPSICMTKPDGGLPDGGSGGPEYGDTMYNAEGDDDDCKYHVKWSATPVYENYNVTFTVWATRRVDGSPLKGADTQIEAYLSDTHPAPNSGTKTTDNGDGSYTIGPVRFDAPGKWTVRFHFNQQCFDFFDTSPHGHAAFYLNVP